MTSSDLYVTCSCALLMIHRFKACMRMNTCRLCLQAATAKCAHGASPVTAMAARLDGKWDARSIIPNLQKVPPAIRMKIR